MNPITYSPRMDLTLIDTDRIYAVLLLMPRYWDGLSAFCVKILSKQNAQGEIIILVKECYTHGSRMNQLVTNEKEFPLVMESETDRAAIIMNACACGMDKKFIDVSHIHDVKEQLDFIKSKFTGAI